MGGSFLVLVFVAGTASAVDRPWLVWERLVPPPDSRTDWISIAQDYPGFPWALRADQPQFPTFAAAAVAADAIRVSPGFSSFCDRSWKLWRNASTGASSVSRDAPAGQGFSLERGGLCCEEAFESAFPGAGGNDCRSVRLLSDPSQVVSPISPPPVVAAPPPGAVPSIQQFLGGSWRADGSTATLSQTGDTVRGSFSGGKNLLNAKGTLSGTLRAGSFSGSWSAVAEGFRVQGTFTMSVDADGRRMVGAWRDSDGHAETIAWSRD